MKSSKKPLATAKKTLVIQKETRRAIFTVASSPPKRVAKVKKSGFDFFFKRTCFRTMTLYYKTMFKPYFQKC